MAIETSLGQGQSQFPSTVWDVLDKGADAELNSLANRYWRPVYRFVRSVWKQPIEDAKDLTQEFFLHAILEGSLLDRFEPERGSFRAFVKTAVRNFLLDADKAAGRIKRGGAARTVPLEMEDFDLSEIVPDAHALPPEQLYDAAWRNSVLARALDVARRRLEGEGKGLYFEVFRRYDLEGGEPAPGYREIGEALGLTVDTVKNYLTRARTEFRDAVLETVCDTVDSEQDLAGELEALFGN